MRSYSEKDHAFVVCAYRESPYLEKCLRSLKRQTRKSRIVVSTSTPNEHIRETASRYGVPVIVSQGGSRGIAADWNFALEAADAPLVTLAHQDDVYETEYTEKIIEAVNRCRRPLIAFSGYSEIRGGTAVKSNRLLRIKAFMLLPMRWRGFWGSRFVRRRILSLGNPICCPSVTMVRAALPRPLFRNNMESNIDWQAWETVSRLKGEFAYVPEQLVRHRIHGESATSRIIGENRRREEDLFMYRKFWPAWIAAGIEHFYQKSERSNQ